MGINALSKHANHASASFPRNFSLMILEKKSQAIRAAIESHLAEVDARRRNFFKKGNAPVTAAWTATEARNAQI